MSAGSKNYLELVKDAYEGNLKLPAFQRKFKWTRSQVTLLYDSIRQGYPIGSIILLEGGDRPEFQARTFRGSSTGAKEKTAKDLVLDGQQRLTAGIDLFFGDSAESGSQYFINLEKLENVISDSNVDIDDDNSVITFLKDLDQETGYCEGRKRVTDPTALLISKNLLHTAMLRPDNSKRLDAFLDNYLERYPEKKPLIRNVIKPFFIIHSPPIVPYTSIDSHFQIDAISRIFATLNSTGKMLTPFELVVAVLFPKGIDLRDDLEGARQEYPHYNFMDKSGELAPQTVALLDGKSPKKNLLPKNLTATAWKKYKSIAFERLEEVGKFLTEELGMALDMTGVLVPYDSIFAPMALVFEKIGFKSLPAAKKAPAKKKLQKWIVGSALSQRYQEGVHNKQETDVKEMAVWIENDDPDYEPQWLRDVQIPPLTSVTPSGAIGRMLRSLINKENLSDPLTKDKINVGLPSTHLHHIFPTKFVPKIVGWDKNKGDKANLLLNTMQLSADTNKRFLNDDPSAQITDALTKSDENSVIEAFLKQGICVEALSVLKKTNKTRDDYRNFLKLRETYFENLIGKYGFDIARGVEEIDDSDEA